MGLKLKILIIIPAFNEAKSIESVVSGIRNESLFDYVVINDGSTDKTKNILQSRNINFIDLTSNLGIGGAVQTGYKYALKNNYDVAVQIDADGQHDLKYVNKILEPIVNGEADLVIGSRFVNKSATAFKSTVMRRIGIRAISNLIRVLAHKRIFDTTSGFRAVNKKVMEEFAKDYPLEYPEPISNFEMLKKGYRIKEISVSMNARTGGKSSIHTWRNGYYMINVFLAILMVQLRSRHEY